MRDKAIYNLYPNVVSINNGQDAYNVLGELVEYDEEDVLEEVSRLEQAYAAISYQRLRAPEYPPVTDLADALYHQSKGDDTKMELYLAACEAVKQKYPKGE